MKRQSILFILLLLLTLTTLYGCSNDDSSNETSTGQPMEISLEEASEESIAFDESVSSGADSELMKLESEPALFEDVIGVFEGLEDNHTALFSFEGVEVVFFFEAPEVQNVLSEAVIGSTYTLSYTYDSSRGIHILHKISE